MILSIHSYRVIEAKNDDYKTFTHYIREGVQTTINEINASPEDQRKRLQPGDRNNGKE